MMNNGPAVVLAALDDVYFVAATGPVKTARAVLGFPQKVCARLKIYALSVAASICPDFGPGVRLLDKRIVSRHGPIIIQPQNFSGQRIQLLRQLTIGRIARRDIQFSIRTKAQTAARMKLRS